MDNYIISIDGGTTNTRIALLKNQNIAAICKSPVGAGACALSGSNAPLKQALCDAVKKLLSDNSLKEDNLDGIYLSGMICSELGLYCLPHIDAPAGVAELAKSVKSVVIPEICSVPMTFIPGVKTVSDKAYMTDIMRGEETELAGIRQLMKIKTPLVLMLPGTHNKIIFADGDGKITSFFTAMSGELAKTVSENTILKEALAKGYTKEPDMDYVLLGYDCAGELGLSAALFKTRILSKFSDASPIGLYSFVLGVILHEDVYLCAKKAENSQILIAGSNPFKRALKMIFDHRTDVSSEIVPDEISDLAVIEGQLEIKRHISHKIHR